MSVLGLKSGYTVKYGHILPYIPPLVLIRIQYLYKVVIFSPALFAFSEVFAIIGLSLSAFVFIKHSFVVTTKPCN